MLTPPTARNAITCSKLGPGTAPSCAATATGANIASAKSIALARVTPRQFLFIASPCRSSGRDHLGVGTVEMPARSPKQHHPRRVHQGVGERGCRDLTC